MLPQNFKWLSPYEMTTYILSRLFNLIAPLEDCDIFSDLYEEC